MKQVPASHAPSVLDHAWRLTYRIAFPAAQLWWRLSGPHHQGALVAIHVGPDLLLLRSSYRSAWNFPGGGVRSGEDPHEAAGRELREEIGIDVPTLQPAGEVHMRIEGRDDHVHFFTLRLDTLPPLRLDNREIIAAALASRDDLARLKLTKPVAAYVARPAA